MTSIWRAETGHLVWHWSEFGQRDRYRPQLDARQFRAPSGYIPPLPDFANRSPFGECLDSNLTPPDATKRYSGKRRVQGYPATIRCLAGWRQIRITLIDPGSACLNEHNHLP
jgi:hypothetical protein